MNFSAEYFVVAGNNLTGSVSSSIRTATLFDDNLIRGDDNNERVESESGLTIFNGYTRFVQTGNSLDSIVREFEDGEISTTITFNDGSSLSDVLGLVDIQTFNYGGFINNYLFDQSALNAVGKTLSDITDVQVDAFVDHGLSFADFGFGEGSEEPIEPEQSVLAGTSGRDVINGTDADEIIIGGDGNDRLSGGAGADTFVFGADARDQGRDRDVIRDFDADLDVIVLENGAQIRNVFERNGDTFIRLEGDRDVIVVRDADASIVENIVFVEEAFFV